MKNGKFVKKILDKLPKVCYNKVTTEEGRSKK
jgi:hypothetical protein